MPVDSAPLPLTPDYGGPLVSYADGVYDTSLNRYISVMEGTLLTFYILFFNTLSSITDPVICNLVRST